MTYRVLLTKAAKSNFVTKMETGYRETKEVTRFQEMKVLIDNITGKPYISVDFDPVDPTIELPTFPKGSVRKITFTSTHYDGFRNDGIYHHKGATARLKTTQKLHTPSTLGDKTHLQVFQEVQISAGSVRTLREIYTMVRAGKISPTEDWGSPTKGPSFEDILGMMALVSAHAQGGGKAPSDMN